MVVGGAGFLGFGFGCRVAHCVSESSHRTAASVDATLTTPSSHRAIEPSRMSRHAQRGSRARDVGIRPATPLVAYAATYATLRMRSGQGGRDTYLVSCPSCMSRHTLPIRYCAVVVTLRGIGNVAYVSACGIRKMALTWGAPVGMSAVAHAITCATDSVRSLRLGSVQPGSLSSA